MLRDYNIVSPSLEGVLDDGSLFYEGLKRPVEVLRVRDIQPSDSKVLEEYFHDLYGIFMKRLSHFIVESETSPPDTVKLQAMLQEMIKVKGMLNR